MNLIQQLAEYQNAPLPTLEAAKKGANPNVSPWVAGAILSDRIEKQKRMAMGQGAAQGPQPTVDEQQDQEVAGIMALQGAPQMQAAQPMMQAAPVEAASGGLMQAKMDPSMFDFCGGGIIAFDEGGKADADDMSQPAKETPYLEQMANVLGLIPEALKALVSAPGSGLNKPRAEEPKKAAPKLKSREELAAEYEKARTEGRSGDATTYVPPTKTPPAVSKPAAPVGGGIAALGPVQKSLTTSPEWATLEEARKREFEAPKIGETAAELAAEKEAHLKAQGITKKPWELASDQTAELRRLMGEETAARKKENEEKERERRYDTFVANLGAGSFGQSSQGGLRANLKRIADQEAEDQRIKELNYNRMLKLDEIDAKAQELRYNEATGDVAAAQKNRQEIAKLKREAQKDQAAVAQVQATQRQLAAAHDAQNATTLAAARERANAGVGAESKEIQLAEAAFARDPEAAAIRKRLEGMISKKDRADGLQRLREIQASKYRQFGLTLEGAGAPRTGVPQYDPSKVREIKR